MKIQELLDTMNYNLSRNSTHKSNLGEIQKSLIDLFFQNPNLTVEQIKSFEANLFSNPNMFDHHIDYSSVNGVDNHFNQRLEAYKSLEGHKTM